MPWAFVIHNIDSIDSIVKRISLIIWYTLRFIMLMNIHLGLLLLPLFFLYSTWTFKLIFSKSQQKSIFPLLWNLFLHLWRMLYISSILKSHIPNYFEFAKIATMQVLASVEDERIGSTLFFMKKYYEIDLQTTYKLVGWKHSQVD